LNLLTDTNLNETTTKFSSGNYINSIINSSDSMVLKSNESLQLPQLNNNSFITKDNLKNNSNDNSDNSINKDTETNSISQTNSKLSWKDNTLSPTANLLLLKNNKDEL